MKSVTIKIGDYDVEVLEKIFANESDFKPRDPRDELLVEIMRQVVETPKIELGPNPAKGE